MDKTKEVIKKLRSERKRRGIFESLKDDLKEKVKNNEEIKKIKFYKNDKENYLFNQGDELHCEIIIKNKANKANINFILDNQKKLKVYSKDIKKDSNQYIIKFKINSLHLDIGNYRIELIIDGKKLMENIKIKIKNGEKKFGKHLVIEEFYEDNSFPKGNYYAFGNVENILDDFNNGRTICVYNIDIEEDEILKHFKKGKVINNK